MYQRIFYEVKFDIHQTNVTIFLFKFLGINFEGGTSYYDLCRDMRTSANNSRLMIELREKGAIAAVARRSFESHARRDRLTIGAIAYEKLRLDRAFLI